MSDKPLKWLIVGTGDIVHKRVAAALRDTPGSEIRAICGGEGRAQAIAQEFSIARVHAELDEALAQSDVDAVYVATPVYRHQSEALRAIEAGKHVLIEKPLGLSVADAQPIVDAAAKQEVTAGCAFYRRCFPRYQTLKQQLAEGALGQVALVRTAYQGWFDPSPDDPKHWRIEPERSGGGALSDMGCHMFDLIVGLFGLPESIFAYADAVVHPTWRVEDSSAIVMRLPGGAQVLATFGWNSKTWTHEFEVVGRDARVRWSPADTGKVLTTEGRDTTEVDLPNAENVHSPLVEDFVTAVRCDRPPVCPLSEAIKTNRVLDAIYRSARSGRAETP